MAAAGSAAATEMEEGINRQIGDSDFISFFFGGGGDEFGFYCFILKNKQKRKSS